MGGNADGVLVMGGRNAAWSQDGGVLEEVWWCVDVVMALPGIVHLVLVYWMSAECDSGCLQRGSRAQVGQEQRGMRFRGRWIWWKGRTWLRKACTDCIVLSVLQVRDFRQLGCFADPADNLCIRRLRLFAGRTECAEYKKNRRLEDLEVGRLKFKFNRRGSSSE